jgi:hypothetical protein
LRRARCPERCTQHEPVLDKKGEPVTAVAVDDAAAGAGRAKSGVEIPKS